MNNKEQLLYFFLQGKISLSQYDYKFMANLQTMIQNKNRVTSNQAALFDNLISKYKKQLSKQGYDKDSLKALSWKTLLVESTVEHTGAIIKLQDDQLSIRVPFNKPFITAFRNVNNNPFEWDKDTKTYCAPFSTIALKVAYTELPKHFTAIRFDDELSTILTEIERYNAPIYNPTVVLVNNKLVVFAANSYLGELVSKMDLTFNANTLFKLSLMGIEVHPSIYSTNPRLEFASKRVYETEITDIENVLAWMKNIGCTNVLIGRGLRNLVSENHLHELISMRGMQPLGPMSFGKLPSGTSMLIQHTSAVDVRNAFAGTLSKIVVLKDSRPIEVQ